MKNVYVVSCEYDSGGSFDWYHTAKDADLAFEHEKENCKNWSDYHWTAFRFDVEVTSKETASDEIDSKLEDLENLPSTKTWKA